MFSYFYDFLLNLYHSHKPLLLSEENEVAITPEIQSITSQKQMFIVEREKWVIFE